MNIVTIFFTVFGLCIFEIANSIDNAIINAQVLTSMHASGKRWFRVWGIFFAVFVVRGGLPLVIVWSANPHLSIGEAFAATLSTNPSVVTAIQQSAPFLFIGGGTFLVLLFMHWLFMGEKNYAFVHEKFIYQNGIWFYAYASIFLTAMVRLALDRNPDLAFAAVLGSCAFFITHGFRENAELEEHELIRRRVSDLSKIVYLEIIDAIFSFDGVLGAFAFTLAIPLILIGNGIGAIVVRHLTLGTMHTIKQYVFLENGAMYAIFFLGCVMIAESFGIVIEPWVAPAVTVLVIVYFFFKSKRALVSQTF